MLTDEQAAESFCYLSTVGRVTGRTHTIEIWFAAGAGGRVLYLLSGGGEKADWVRNLRADARVHVRVGGKTWDAVARVVVGTERRGPAATVHDKYAPSYRGDLTRWRDTALLVVVELQPPA